MGITKTIKVCVVKDSLEKENLDKNQDPLYWPLLKAQSIDFNKDFLIIDKPFIAFFTSRFAVYSVGENKIVTDQIKHYAQSLGAVGDVTASLLKESFAHLKVFFPKEKRGLKALWEMSGHPSVLIPWVLFTGDQGESHRVAQDLGSGCLPGSLFVIKTYQLILIKKIPLFIQNILKGNNEIIFLIRSDLVLKALKTCLSSFFKERSLDPIPWERFTFQREK